MEVRWGGVKNFKFCLLLVLETKTILFIKKKKPVENVLSLEFLFLVADLTILSISYLEEPLSLIYPSFSFLSFSWPWLASSRDLWNLNYFALSSPLHHCRLFFLIKPYFFSYPTPSTLTYV
uniref:Uncharacterized protein n=1 Tax=Octopus bimaculoides TaxID=37653 RepID=A0A0L8I167_OCTBM